MAARASSRCDGGAGCGIGKDGLMAAPRKAERLKMAKEGKAEAKNARGAPTGSYPTDTKKRARAAKSYASAAVNAGRMSAGTERGIDRRADKELGKGKKR
jgi:hypothetical protein